MPRLVAASAFQDDRANEEGETCSALNAFNFPKLTSRPVETRSFTSMSSSELFKSSESLELPW